MRRLRFGERHFRVLRKYKEPQANEFTRRISDAPF